MIVDRAIYVDGARQPCGDLSAELRKLRTCQSGYLWIGLRDPTDEEFDAVNGELELHPLAVEDAVKGNQRAKIEHYEGSLLVVLKTLRYVEATSDVETGEVMVFLGDRFVLTIRRGELNPLAGVRARLEQQPEQLALGPAAVLHAVMDSVVDNYLVIESELGEDLDRIEHEVFTGSRDEHHSIYRLKREVLEFRRAAFPLADGLKRLDLPEYTGLLGREILPFFRDVADHLARATDHVETYDRLLTDVLHAHLADISVRQNEDMRRISAWVAMAAVPTLIAGVYGMNFRFMPELDASITVAGTEVYWGYFAVLAMVVAVIVGLYRMFKRAGWL